jgi:hypothetical protein
MTRPIVKTIQSLLDQSWCLFIQRNKTHLATSSTAQSVINSQGIRDGLTDDSYDLQTSDKEK